MFNFFNISPCIFIINLSFLQGGLTTPDCNEAVLWTNLKATQTISEAQLEIFRSMTDSDGVTLNNNYRPPQPLNARTIYTTGVSKLLCTNDAPFDLMLLHGQCQTYYLVDNPKRPKVWAPDKLSGCTPDIPTPVWSLFRRQSG